MTQADIQQNFNHMNPMQREAVFCTEGPLLILAGAGSGKTTVLVNRIAYILQSELCRPWNILAITFTNKSAGELKERICNAVPEGGNDIWAATFHSTCARILRRYGDRLGYSSHFHRRPKAAYQGYTKATQHRRKAAARQVSDVRDFQGKGQNGNAAGHAEAG